jgi:hypothetical protein
MSKVIQFSKSDKFIKEWESVSKASKELAINKKHIYKAVSRNTSTHGFKFKYSDYTFEDEFWMDHPCGRKVSNLGRVKSKTHYPTYGAHRPSGYMVVFVNDKMKLVHRLVLEAFTSVDEGKGLYVDHIDRDKTNNRIENLRWVTQKENMQNRSPPTPFKHCKSCNCFK